MEKQKSNKKVEGMLIDCLQRGFSWEFCSKLEDALNRLEKLKRETKRKDLLLALMFKAFLLSAKEEVGLVL
ncbi:hypothetical protein TK1742 [Thermococcus kodakarensis KOD1]|uniref:Uncharacterized protein n=2 Tax=Thermococcus TaxID=2263 RepID=Q5JJ37_THEKO|nr:hypothetical protein TK1742 [Thermococcus kodakarensis KOD1]